MVKVVETTSAIQLTNDKKSLHERRKLEADRLRV
jgi:hypothetical protein